MADNVSLDNPANIFVFSELGQVIAEIEQQTATLEVATAICGQEVDKPHTSPIDFNRIVAEMEECGVELSIALLPDPAKADGHGVALPTVQSDEKDDPASPCAPTMPSDSMTPHYAQDAAVRALLTLATTSAEEGTAHAPDRQVMWPVRVAQAVWVQLFRRGWWRPGSRKFSARAQAEGLGLLASPRSRSWWWRSA